MLMRTDPFREFDRLSQHLFGQSSAGTWTRPASMPIDAYRVGDEYVVALDLPGVDADAIEIDIERNVLTVKAERRPLKVGDDVQVQLSERPLGVFSRQLFLGDALDTANIQAAYENGVLLLKIPVTEKAKPRKVAVASSDTRKTIEA
jgi:HSP20 family protein